MKKILSLVLAMLMIFSMVPAVFAAETSESDYQAAIEYLSAIDLWKGYGDGEDGADDQVLRYQMALFTARMVTGRTDAAYWETDANDSGFTDIDELNAEALGGVCYAAQQGIVNGIGGSEFAPLDNVTYRDAIVMIVRALGFNYPASGYPWSYINKARELGVLDGITGVSYTAEVKREVIAQLLYNAINAEIKGESIAANVFGVEETIVMVTASYDLTYVADASKSLKDTMVKVSAIDAEGEPIGAEYYVSYRTLGAKNPTQANALVGTYFKVTHKGNFAEFLTVESLTKVFENTPADKSQIKYNYSSDTLTLGGEQYLAITTANYSDLLNNTQTTVKGAKEVKVFKAYGATKNDALNVGSDFILAADGNIYHTSNPFVPYAVYSALVDRWFKVVTDNIVTTPDATAGNLVTSLNKTYQLMDPDEVNDILEKSTHLVQGHSRVSEGYFGTGYNASGLADGQYDYYKAIASDIDGDGDYDRVISRPYELLRISKWTERELELGSSSSYINVTKFTAASYFNNAENQDGYSEGKIQYVDRTLYACTGTDYNGRTEDLYRITGIKLDKVPNNAFVIAYISRGASGADKEIEIIEVIGGAQEDAEDNAYVFQTYIRGYDSVTNKVVYGANYDTMYIGSWNIKNSTMYDAPGAPGSYRPGYTARTAAYVQQFWNKYVNVYVLNGAIIHIEEVGNNDDFVILDAFTDFTEDGLKAMAYSTLDGGYAEVTIGQLNGWSLGGYDYELFMLLKQMTDLGLTVKDYPLPIALNKIYSVRSVDENGAYNLVEAVPMNDGKPASVYVNNYGYILGVKDDGTLNAESRVPTSDKDLWIIQTQEYLKDAQGNIKVDDQGNQIIVAGKVVMFKGKLSAIELVGFKWYKVADNQYVAIAPVGANLGPILGNTSEGLDYWMYNQFINNYKNETLFNGFYYGHYMTNVRTGAVEFVTYDSKLASDLFGNNPADRYNYIVLEEGEIYPAINKVLKINVPTTMKAVADLQYASAKYHAYETLAVGAVLPTGLKLDAAINKGVLTSDIKGAYNNYTELRDAIAMNLYAGVYNKDFTNDNTDTDVYAQIKKELLANVTFVNRTTGNKYDSWVGYNSSKDTWPTPAAAFGSATQYVKAYVMYDYANASAKVFIDSKDLITAQNAVDTSVKTINHATLGTVTVTYACNLLNDTTNVTVAFTDEVTATITVDTQTISFVGDVAKFVVAGNFSDDITVTAATTNLTTLTKVAHDKVDYVKAYGILEASAEQTGFLTDGKYHHEGATSYTSGDWSPSFISFANNAYDANLNAVAPASAGAKYWGAITFELAEAKTLKGFRIATPYIAQGTPVGPSFAHQAYDVLVSTDDGATWTLVASYRDLVNDIDNTGWKLVDDTILDYYAFEGMLNVVSDATNVAVAIPGANVAYASATADRENNSENGLVKFKSGSFNHLIEVEFYY